MCVLEKENLDKKDFEELFSLHSERGIYYCPEKNKIYVHYIGVRKGSLGFGAGFNFYFDGEIYEFFIGYNSAFVGYV